MKKIIIAILFLGPAIAGFSQQPVQTAKTKNSKELTSDVKTINRERVAKDKNELKGHKTMARVDKTKVKADKAKRDRDVAKLKKEGVKHPMEKADKDALTKKNNKG